MYDAPRQAADSVVQPSDEPNPFAAVSETGQPQSPIAYLQAYVPHPPGSEPLRWAFQVMYRWPHSSLVQAPAKPPTRHAMHSSSTVPVCAPALAGDDRAPHQAAFAGFFAGSAAVMHAELCRQAEQQLQQLATGLQSCLRPHAEVVADSAYMFALGRAAPGRLPDDPAAQSSPQEGAGQLSCRCTSARPQSMHSQPQPLVLRTDRLELSLGVTPTKSPNPCRQHARRRYARCSQPALQVAERCGAALGRQPGHRQQEVVLRQPCNRAELGALLLWCACCV